MRQSRVSKNTTQIDPLFVIFEQHICNFSDPELNRKEFIHNVIQDYLRFLSKLKIVVPQSLAEPMIEELQSQVNVMLIKKIYGYLSIQEYQKNLPKTQREKVRSKYKRLVTQRG
ncbi:hypothetical protein EBS43_06150 [bacterium]|jgi:hypothetical protein|nr:hypothetical protein [bacterium]